MPYHQIGGGLAPRNRKFKVMGTPSVSYLLAVEQAATRKKRAFQDGEQVLTPYGWMYIQRAYCEHGEWVYVLNDNHPNKPQVIHGLVSPYASKRATMKEETLVAWNPVITVIPKALPEAKPAPCRAIVPAPCRAIVVYQGASSW